MTKISIALILITSIATPATIAAQNSSECPLLTARNGQTITVRGEVETEPHDMALEIPDCKIIVLATFAGDLDSDVPKTQLRNDRAMKKFIKYINSTYKSRGSHICMECSKYGNVRAELTGKLEIAVTPDGATRDHLGRTWDANGKFIGIFGWGHPVPFADYRLVIESVSEVNARRIPKPKL